MSKYDDFRDDDFEDDEFERDEAERMAEEIVSNSKAALDAEFNIAEKSIRCELLDKAIYIAKSTWLWWFLPQSSKIRRINKVFQSLRQLVR